LLAAFPAMKILFISGYPGIGEQMDPAITALHARFLGKPFSLQQFFSEVEKTLANNTAASGS
jgi:hypothetical protein